MRARRKGSQYAYGVAPVIHHSRSMFDLSHKHAFTTSVGRLTPCFLEEVYPGDDFKIDVSMVARVTSSFLKPVMDNLFADVYFFFVPSRLLYDDMEEVFGSARPSQWTDPQFAIVPAIGHGSVVAGSIADYFGLPLVDFSSTEYAVSVLPFRAYAKIYNDWFRDENLVNEVLIQTGEASSSEQFNSNAFSASNYTGMCASVAKMHDYFTQALPAPQKGAPVTIGSASVPETVVPVLTSNKDFLPASTTQAYPMRFLIGNIDTQSFHNPMGISAAVQYPTGYFSSYPLNVYSGQFSGEEIRGIGSDSSSEQQNPDFPNRGIVPTNLSATFPATPLFSANVNDLRFAFQMQKMLERDALGTRYVEYVRNHFGVDAGDARLQRSEYLGGKRIPINVTQVAQTSQASEDSPLGNVAALSLTSAAHFARVSKGFVEHGYIVGVIALRYHHTYQQGIRAFWFRQQRSDFYDPLFANLGDQPLYVRELFAAVDSVDPTGASIFGYKPAWDELRTSPNQISGQLRSDASEGLDIWHFADQYSSVPTLGSQWITETPSFVDRTLSVPSTTVDQFIVDMWFNTKAVRPLPTFGIPGLIDHH